MLTMHACSSVHFNHAEPLTWVAGKQRNSSKHPGNNSVAFNTALSLIKQISYHVIFDIILSFLLKVRMFATPAQRKTASGCRSTPGTIDPGTKFYHFLG
jgi:hypothetical protein